MFQIGSVFTSNHPGIGSCDAEPIATSQGWGLSSSEFRINSLTTWELSSAKRLDREKHPLDLFGDISQNMLKRDVANESCCID